MVRRQYTSDRCLVGRLSAFRTVTCSRLDICQVIPSWKAELLQKPRGGVCRKGDIRPTMPQHPYTQSPYMGMPCTPWLTTDRDKSLHRVRKLKAQGSRGGVVAQGPGGGVSPQCPVKNLPRTTAPLEIKARTAVRQAVDLRRHTSQVGSGSIETRQSGREKCACIFLVWLFFPRCGSNLWECSDQTY